MRAQEVQLERVVHRLGPGRARARSSTRSSRRAAGGVGAGGVEELAPGHGDQPALRVPRRVVRPDAHGLDQRVLHGVLGRREVGSATDEDADHAGGEGPQQGLVHRAVTP